MKRTFWTRNLFIGVLMGLVILLGMQSTADALSFTSQITRTDRPNVSFVYPNQTFDLRFTVRLESSTAVNPNTTAGSATDISYASGSSTRAVVPVKIITDTGYDAGAGTTHYTVSSSSDTASIPGVRITTDARTWTADSTVAGAIPGNPTDRSYASGSRTRTPPTATITTDTGYDAGTGTTHYTVSTTTTTASGVRLTTHARTWITEAAAYYYNEEAVTITPGSNISIISINGYTVNTAAGTAYELNEDENWGGTTTSELSQTTINVKCQAGGSTTVGQTGNTVAVSDTTPATDYPGGASDAATPPTSSPFQITVVHRIPAAADIPTLSLVSAASVIRAHETRTPITATLTGTNANSYEVDFAIASGSSGTLSEKQDGTGNTGRSLTAYTAATGTATVTVYLNPSRSTTKVQVTVAGRSPGSTDPEHSRTVTVFYQSFNLEADLTLDGPGGNGQSGVISTRLANPFVVKVTDGTNRGVSGQAVTFTPAPGNPGSGDVLFPHSDFRAESTSTGSTTAGYDPLVVKTDRSGEAKVYFELGDTTGTYTVDATFSGITRTFTATALSTTTTRVLRIDTENSVQEQSVARLTTASKPLVVRVLAGGVSELSGQPVRFTTADGDLSPRREAMQLQDTDSTPPIPDLPTDRTIETNARGEAWIDYTAGNTEGPVTIYARAYNYSPTDGTGTFTRLDSANTVIFRVNVGGSSPTREPTTREPAAPRNIIGISPASITGEPDEEITLSITSDPSVRFVTLSSDDFANSLFSPQSGTTPFQSTLTLPDEDGEYTISASSAGLTSGSATVTVETGILGRITISQIGQPSGGAQNFSIRVVDTDGDQISSPLTVRLSGSGFTTRNIETLNGFGDARLTLPTAAGTYTLTASAEDYTSGTTQVRIAAPEPPQDTAEDEEEEEEEASEPASIEISGPPTRTGTANTAIEAPLLVQVLDDDDDAIEDARVIFRVRKGQGRLSQRGNGRAVAIQTDSRGYARAEYTPISASSTVEAEVRGVRTPVTFTITATDAVPSTDTPDTGEDTPPDTIRPTVHTPAAQRPPMLWVAGGKIYSLVGAEVHEFAPNLNNVMNITIGGGKVYWTAKTSASSGTINSANLDGSGVKELKSIMAIPIGIAVDTTNSLLYWTNSRGRIQSANLDGSGIQNVMENIRNPNDLALAGGNVYWTESNHGSVRFVNLRGQKQIRVISTGDDPAGSLVIGGGKVYWTEKVGESGGTINSANLNGSGATELASILSTPIGIAVDTARSKLYWTNARGRVQSASLSGSSIRNVVSGLESPGEIVLSNSIKAPKATTPTKSTTTAAGKNKYDINGDGKVDSTDTGLVVLAISTGDTSAKLDVNGDGKVNFSDYVLVSENVDAGAAGAPSVFSMKMSAAQIERLQEQIELLIASGDRSPAAMRALIYFQQLIATARPEKTQLLANYPNPFNPETWMPYELATDTNVKITIYNTQGVVIRTLELGQQSAGYYTGRERAAYWDGRNAFGEQVASGIYFYQLETDTMSALRKMVILK